MTISAGLRLVGIVATVVELLYGVVTRDVSRIAVGVGLAIFWGATFLLEGGGRS